MTLGERMRHQFALEVRALRIHLGVNQQGLCRLLGVARASIARWERAEVLPHKRHRDAVRHWQRVALFGDDLERAKMWWLIARPDDAELTELETVKGRAATVADGAQRPLQAVTRRHTLSSRVGKAQSASPTHDSQKGRHAWWNDR